MANQLLQWHLSKALTEQEKELEINGFFETFNKKNTALGWLDVCEYNASTKYENIWIRWMPEFSDTPKNERIHVLIDLDKGIYGGMRFTYHDDGDDPVVNEEFSFTNLNDLVDWILNYK